LYRNHELKLKTLEVNTKQAVLKESYGAYQIEVSQANPEPAEIAGESAEAVAKTTALLGMGMGALGFADLWESINRGVAGVADNAKGTEILASIDIAFLVPYYFLDKALNKAAETSSESSPANETSAAPNPPGLYSLSCGTLLQNVDEEISVSAGSGLYESSESLTYGVGFSKLLIAPDFVSCGGKAVTLTVGDTSAKLTSALVSVKGPMFLFDGEKILDFEEG
jgi:hypothetical protein